MSEQTHSASSSSIAGEAMASIAEHHRWFLVLGIALVIVGALAIIFPFVSTLAASIAIGWLLVVGGIVTLIHSFQAKRWVGVAANLLIGVIYTVGGLLLLANPLAGVLTLTLVLIAIFLANGVLQIIMALRLQPTAGWGWVLASGILGLIVGGMIWAKLPSSAIWAIGLLVGIQMIFSGWSFIMLATSARKEA